MSQRATDLTGAVYTRMSQDIRQLGDGVERQYESCHELAARDETPIIAEFQDNDISAYDRKKIRPDFEKVLHAIERHDFDILYLWHTDRLYRQMEDAVRLLAAARKGRVILAPVKGSRIDPSKAGDEMVAYILAAVNQGESRHHAERRIAANKQRAERGEWSTANRPFGYTQDGQPHPIEADLFRDAVADILAGKSIRAVVRAWNEAGITTTRGNKWNATQVRKMLPRPRYAALVTHHGKTYPGNWQHLITLDTHHALVHFLNNPERSNGRVSWEQKYLGSGLYFCGICKTITMQSCANGVANPLTYRCRASKHVTCNAASLDDFVQGRILDWFARNDCQNLIKTSATIRELREERDGLQSEVEMYLAHADEGTITPAEFGDVVKKRKKRIGEINNELASAASATAASALIDVSQKAQRAGKDALKAVTDYWFNDMSVTQRAQAAAEVAIITVGPATKRGPGFDENRVDLTPRWLAI